MSNGSAAYTREEMKTLLDLAEKESNIQLCNWFIQILGSGMTIGMLRRVVFNKIIEIKGQGEKA